MFSAGKGNTTEPGEDDASSGDTTAPPTNEQPRAKRLKIVATVLGVLGALLSVAVPFLPVFHDIGTLKWPTAQGTQSVSAPLATYSPVWIDAEVPCASARDLDARSDAPGVLVSTNPTNSEYGKVTGLTLQVINNQVTLLSKGQQLGTALVPPGDCSITIQSNASGTTAKIGDQTVANANGDQRAQLTGIYSELDDQQDNVDGLSFEARVDNRYESYATPLKWTAIALALVCFVGSVICLRKLDVRAGRRPPRLAPPGWWKPTLRDTAVVGVLGAWWLIGAMTSDDGYILTIARAREATGYISNYYRWFAVPEAPFGWFYELYSLWVQVSTTVPWVRLPALLMGILSWLLISREVLPRLGQQVRRSNAAGWAAAAVFLAFWLPYNNGMRPEPVVVLFSLLALCAVERAVATRRLMPAALGLVGAALAVGANPHGLVAVLPFVAALKPLLKLLHERAKQFGWLPVLAPIAACGLVILTVVFADQTWQSTMEATELRTDIGPSEEWYQELSRYNALFGQSPDGSLTRRFPVLLVILCLATCAVVLLRRGRIRGAALGPSRRLLAVTALSFVVLMATPTKWSHHFGVFAAVGGALAALTALATSSTVLRSKRNRMVFFAGLMMIFAFAATGTNAWWYVSGWGVPWFDIPPSYNGYAASTVLLLAAAVAGIIAFVEHLKLDPNNPQVVDDQLPNRRPGSASGMELRSRALRLGTAPLAILCALLVVGEVAVFAKVIQKQWGSYSLGADNIKQISGASCGLSDYVFVETNPKAGLLTVSGEQPSVANPEMDVPQRLREEETPNEYLGAKLEGFNRPGLPPGDGSDPFEPDWKPPHEFGGDDAPVWGSYDPEGLGTGELRTQWYDLPERATSGQVPVVLTMAGTEVGANGLVAEFGRETENGFEMLQRRPVAQGGGPQWREARLTLDGPPKDATKMRLVAVDQSLGVSGWLGVGAPRAPQLTNMTDVVGDSPTYVEWTAAFVHPCLQPSRIRNGIAEMPEFRVAAGAELRGMGQGWSSPEAGGAFGWMNVTATMREMPTYMQGNINRDWGSLYTVDPYAPDALPAETALVQHRETHWGRWSPGPISPTVSLPGDVPTSDDRNDVQGFGEDGNSDE